MASATEMASGNIDVAADETPARRAWRRLARRKSAMVGLVIVVALILIAILAPLIAPFDPTQQAYAYVRKPPSWRNWLGTDESGRDVLSRIIFGARASLMASFRSLSRSASACRSAYSPAIAGVGPTP
jgi:peptide/nickel transport system permease protein